MLCDTGGHLGCNECQIYLGGGGRFGRRRENSPSIFPVTFSLPSLSSHLDAWTTTSRLGLPAWKKEKHWGRGWRGQVYLYLTKCWLVIKYSLNKLSKYIYSATAVVAKGFWLRSNYKIETSLSFYLEHNLPSRCTASSQAFSVIAFR